MKVAIHVDGPTIRGNEKQVVAIARELRRRGHDVVVSCRVNGPVRRALEAVGVRTTAIRPRGDLDLWHALRFAWWLRRERPDAVLLTSWVRDFIGAWAARVARVPRVVLRVGGVHTLAGVRGLTHRRALTRYIDAIIANSRMVTDHLRRELPEIAEVVTIPNGVETRGSSPAPLRSELAIPADAVIVASVGGMEHRKGFDLLVQALAALSDQRVHLVIVGDGVRRAQLSAAAEELGLTKRVHMPGHRSDIAALLAASDIFVLSSRSEGMSVALLEAMAARRPIIATDVGGAWEALAARDGRNAAGWIVPAEDAHALGEALGTVIGDLRSGGFEAVRRAAEAQWRIENWFTVERMMDGVEAVLRGEEAA